MKVKELIKALEVLPEEAEVYHLWDGLARTRIKHVWLSRKGDVVTADYGEPCYDEEDRPPYAPTKEVYWKTPGDPNL
jgi:hypothetical protein